MNLKVGRVSLVEVGALVMEVFGFTVSTVNDRVAGTEVRFPLESTARMLKVWIPWLKPVYAFGEVQVVQEPESRRHSKVAPPSVEVKANEAEVDAR